MVIRVECKKCQSQFRVKDEAAGKIMKCKSCGAAIKITEVESLEDGDDFLSALGDAANMESVAQRHQAERPASMPVTTKKVKKRKTKKESMSSTESESHDEWLPKPLARYVSFLYSLLFLEVCVFTWGVMEILVEHESNSPFPPAPPGIKYLGYALIFFGALLVYNLRQKFLKGDALQIKLGSIYHFLFFLLLPVIIFGVSFMEHTPDAFITKSSFIAMRVLSCVQVVIGAPFLYYFVIISEYRNRAM